MQNLAEQLLSRFMVLCQQKGENIDVGDAAMIISELTGFMEKYNIENQSNLYNEIREISKKITCLREEIQSHIPDGALLDARQELNDITKSTEEATDKILNAAGSLSIALESIGDKEVVEKIKKEVANIYEACTFQDITGQRVKKVNSLLQSVENLVAGMLNTFTNKSPIVTQKQVKIQSDKDLLNGPQHEGEIPSQDDVDKMFDDA